MARNAGVISPREGTMDHRFCDCGQAECPAHEGRRVRLTDWVRGVPRIALWEEGTVIGCSGSVNLIVRFDTSITTRSIPRQAVKVVERTRA
jgi:hypothetical protein